MYDALRPIKDHLVPAYNNFVELGRSLLRWARLWAVDADFSGVVTVSRTPTATTDAANKAYVDAAGLIGLTIEEVDGAPSVANATVLRFDQADGFVVTNPAGTTLRVDLAAIPVTLLSGSYADLGTTLTGTIAVTELGGSFIDLGTTLTGTLPVADGGTNLASGTDGGILGYTAAGTLASSALLTLRGLIIGGGAGATPTAIAALTNGQLPIGSTGANPVPATLTAGSGITITNGAGTITIAASATVFPLTPVAAAFPTTNFPQLVKNSDTNWTSYTLDYDQTTSEEAFWYAAIPTGVTLAGATCEIWYRTSVTAGTIQWDIETLTRADGEAWDTNGTTDTSAADTVPGVAQQVGYVSTALTTTGWAAGEALLMRIARNIADTAAADVKLIHALIRLT